MLSLSCSQAGYLFCSYYWGWLLEKGWLHWRLPFIQCSAGFTLLLAACAAWLHERPPRPPTSRQKRDSFAAQAAAIATDDAESKSAATDGRARRSTLSKLMRKAGAVLVVRRCACCAWH